MDPTRRMLFGVLLVIGVPLAIVIAIPVAIVAALILHLYIACKMCSAVCHSAVTLALRPIRERWLWGDTSLALPRRG